MKYAVVLLLVTLLGASAFLQTKEQDYVEYLKEIAREINSEDNTWTASINHLDMFDGMTREEIVQSTTGAKSSIDFIVNNSNIKINEADEQFTESDDIPTNFDSREAWSNCESIKEIRDQSKCGSCWAFGGTEVFSDRWCIASGQKQQVRFSAENLISCCDYCGNGCKGGYNVMVWDYFQTTGIVEGGVYQSTNKCQAYTYPPKTSPDYKSFPNGVQTPKCRYQCDKGYNGQSYTQNLHYTKSAGLITSKNIKAIQTEIMTNGPVEVLFFVYDDLYTYHTGVYKHKKGKLAGGHAVKLLGWGVEGKTPYWLCANSWGTSFGIDGFFKIYRGHDECGIEHEITYGTPDLEREF